MRKPRMLTLLLLCLFSVSVWAQGISMKFQNDPLPTALKRIEKASSYRFVFAYDDVKGYKVNGSVTNSSINEVMSYILSDFPLNYRVEGRMVYITRGRQNRTANRISGVVLDSRDGEPIVGATVKVVGTNVGAVTDLNGRFSIDYPAKGNKVQVSYVGMTSQTLNASDYLNIKLSGDLKVLNDVVVVGYGTTRRKDLTGSVATVNPDELVNAPALTIDDALAGKAAGVQVTKADGSPGGAVRIRVRGGSSLTGGVDPLYIIDGIPTEITNNYISSADVNDVTEWSNYGEQEMGAVSAGFMRGLNSLAGLNMEDIETITVMKDASATAIYGSKAANGVVIITTKRGRHDQKPTFNLKYSFGVSHPVKEKVLNGEQYLSTLTNAINNSNTNIQHNMDLGDLMETTGNTLINSNNELLQKVLALGNANTDWLDMVLRNGISHNVDFSVTGGSERSRYYTSVGYSRTNGTLIGTDFQRLTGNVSMDNDITSRFRTFLKVNLSYSKNNISSGLYSQALTAPPILPAYNEDGTFAQYTSVGGFGTSYMGYQNPMAVATVTNNAKTYGIKGSFSGEYDVLKDLKFKSTVSLDYSNYNQVNYVPSYVNISSFYGAESSNGGTGSQSQSIRTGVFWENTLTYNHEFNENHSLNFVLGHSWETDKMSFFSAAGQGYPDDTHLNNLSSAALATSVSGANPSAKSSLLSFYGRVNYTLMNRYLFTFTGRSDTSSKFSKAHRTGFFPSGAVAWRIKEEPFMKNVKWVDDLKLRASIGKTGTQNISDWMFLTLYSPDSYAGSTALYPSQLGNDDIKWESTTEKDLGLDFSILKGRLSGTVNYYYKVTDGALLSVTPPPSSGFTTYISNIAKIRNQGIEVELNAQFLHTKDWTWSGSLNLSHNTSLVKKINSYSGNTELNLGTSIIREGKGLGMLCGYVADGIIQNEEELAEYKKAFPMWSYMTRDLGVGSYRFKLDDTGMYYKDVIGDATPDVYGGYTNTLTYKNWSLLACFTYSIGNDMIYQKDVADRAMSSLANRGIRVLDASNVGAFNGHQTNLYNTTVMLTNLNVYDASYLKLQTLSLAYNFSKSVLTKLHLSSLQLYATASNVFTITSYPGPDPAVTDDPYSVYGGGRDVSTYPTVKSWNFGVRVGF